MKWKWSEITPESWILIGALLALAAVMLLLSNGKRKWNAKALAFASVCIALSFVLSYIRLWKMPQGGSVTPASMLPLMAFSILFGPVPGLLACVVYGLLQLIQNPEVFSLAQAILDYPLAFGCLALAGLGPVMFPKKGRQVFSAWLIGILLASLGRYICHTLSGYVFFAEYAAGSGLSPLLYTLVYNSFVLVEAALCVLISAIPQIRSALNRMAE